MENTTQTWKVQNTTTYLPRAGRICGTTVTLGDRTMKWAGRMTKKSAIAQTSKYWADEDTLAAYDRDGAAAGAVA